MYPVLFKLGKLTIYTYGFFVAMGFLVGILIAKMEAKRLEQDPQMIMDLAFYILIAAIIGSRLFYVMTNPKIFLSNPLEILKIWNGGLVFYGGFIAALLTALIYLKKQKIELWKVADIMAPALAAGHFLGRLGCFFAGCCYGKICDLPWAVTFTHPDTLAPVGIPLHPTQLYSALGNLIIFSFLWLFRRRKKFDGQLFWLYVVLYGISRTLIEILRDDFRGYFFYGILSISQLIGITLIIIAIGMLVFLAKRTEKA
ncbi:MAG: prolipoprotein diacylglyceryl transferase [Desulfobacterales bacterium]|nr:prolipoprotein diacylglyceryl transferase [Desulfobacterales bacterium]